MWTQTFPCIAQAACIVVIGVTPSEDTKLVTYNTATGNDGRKRQSWNEVESLRTTYIRSTNEKSN